MVRGLSEEAFLPSDRVADAYAPLRDQRVLPLWKISSTQRVRLPPRVVVLPIFLLATCLTKSKLGFDGWGVRKWVLFDDEDK